MRLKEKKELPRRERGSGKRLVFQMPGEDSVSMRMETSMMANAAHQPMEMKSDH